MHIRLASDLLIDCAFKNESDKQKYVKKKNVD